MNDDDPSRSRKAVGVYDRPASADRPHKIRLIVTIVATVISLLVAYFAFVN